MDNPIYSFFTPSGNSNHILNISIGVEFVIGSLGIFLISVDLDVQDVLLFFN